MNVLALVCTVPVKNTGNVCPCSTKPKRSSREHCNTWDAPIPNQLTRMVIRVEVAKMTIIFRNDSSPIFMVSKTVDGLLILVIVYYTMHPNAR